LFILFFSMLIGAVIAKAAGDLGGRQRDELPTSRRSPHGAE
jgi:hypothetical protein